MKYECLLSDSIHFIPKARLEMAIAHSQPAYSLSDWQSQDFDDLDQEVEYLEEHNLWNLFWQHLERFKLPFVDTRHIDLRLPEYRNYKPHDFDTIEEEYNFYSQNPEEYVLHMAFIRREMALKHPRVYQSHVAMYPNHYRKLELQLENQHDDQDNGYEPGPTIVQLFLILFLFQIIFCLFNKSEV